MFTSTRVSPMNSGRATAGRLFTHPSPRVRYPAAAELDPVELNSPRSTRVAAENDADFFDPASVTGRMSVKGTRSPISAGSEAKHRVDYFDVVVPFSLLTQIGWTKAPLP